MFQILLKVMAVEGLFLVNAYYYILPCMTANKWGGYFQEWERQELLLQNFSVGQCSAKFFSPTAHPNLSDTWQHTTKFRFTKSGYETICGHKYVSTYKFLPYKNAGIWKQKITYFE
jgi:hypothetical protein